MYLPRKTTAKSLSSLLAIDTLIIHHLRDTLGSSQTPCASLHDDGQRACKHIYCSGTVGRHKIYYCKSQENIVNGHRLSRRVAGGWTRKNRVLKTKLHVHSDTTTIIQHCSTTTDNNTEVQTTDKRLKYRLCSLPVLFQIRRWAPYRVHRDRCVKGILGMRQQSVRSQQSALILPTEDSPTKILQTFTKPA